MENLRSQRGNRVLPCGQRFERPAARPRLQSQPAQSLIQFPLRLGGRGLRLGQPTPRLLSPRHGLTQTFPLRLGQSHRWLGDVCRLPHLLLKLRLKRLCILRNAAYGGLRVFHIRNGAAPLLGLTFQCLTQRQRPPDPLDALSRPIRPEPGQFALQGGKRPLPIGAQPGNRRQRVAAASRPTGQFAQPLAAIQQSPIRHTGTQVFSGLFQPLPGLLQRPLRIRTAFQRPLQPRGAILREGRGHGLQPLKAHPGEAPFLPALPDPKAAFQHPAFPLPLGAFLAQRRKPPLRRIPFGGEAVVTGGVLFGTAHIPAHVLPFFQRGGQTRIGAPRPEQVLHASGQLLERRARRLQPRHAETRTVQGIAHAFRC